MSDQANTNKITDKYSSKNVQAQTLILNIRVLFLAHLRLKLLKSRRNQTYNLQLQLLQFRILNNSFLKISKFLQEKLEPLLQRLNLSRHILMHLNKVSPIPLLLKANLQPRVNRLLSKLLDNRVRLLSQLQISNNNSSSNSLRFRWFAVSTRGFCWLLVKEIITRDLMDRAKLLMARMDHRVLLASIRTLPWVKPDVYATKIPTAITTQTAFSTSHTIIT